MHRLSFAFLLSCSPAAAVSEPWHGIWSAEPDWCVNADQIGSITPAPILFSADEMLGYENSCAVSQVQDTGLNAWVIDLACQSEGDTYDERRLVMVDIDRLWMWFGGDEPILFERCTQ